MAKSNSGQKVITPKGRFMYVFVFKPREGDQKDSVPKYSVTMVFKKSTDLSKLDRAIKTAALNKWGDRYKKMRLSLPIHDGKERQDEDGNQDPLFKNSVFFTARSTERPEIVDENLDAITTASEFYSGCYGRASVYAFAYDNNGKRGVSLLLNNAQKLEDGEKLTNRLSAEEEFKEGNDDEDEDERPARKKSSKRPRRDSDEEEDDEPY